MSAQPPHPAAAATPRARLSADERRESILLAARREFARAGYHGASTASIARAAGCSEPMLYKHFAGKQDLFTAVLETVNRVMEREFDEIISNWTGQEDHWERAVPRIMQNPHYVETMQLRKLAVTLIAEPQVRQAIERIQQRLHARTGEAVRRGIATGFFRPDVDPTYVAWMWQGLMFTACYREHLEPGGFAATAPYVLEFINGLRPCTDG